MPTRKRLIIVKQEGVDALRKYLREVFLNGKNPNEVFDEVKDQLIETNVWFLSWVIYPNVIIAAKTIDGEALLPDILVGNVQKSKIIRPVPMDVYVGPLLIKDGNSIIKMRYISLDGPIIAPSKARVYGAEIGVLRPKSIFVDSTLIIAKIKEWLCT